MRIGLLVTSIGDFGKKGFYNTQEIGLAKALAPLAEEVKVYRLISCDESGRTEAIDGCPNAEAAYIPSKGIGSNGMVDVSLLDTDLDAMIYFSDTQLAVGRVYRWAKKNSVALFPYIGVTESHSENHIKKLLADLFSKRSIRVYQKCMCFAKTPFVKEELGRLGVKNTAVIPVGLDMSLLKGDFEGFDKADLRKKWGYEASHRVILFVGRLIEEKQPLLMTELFKELAKNDDNYRLIMVGSGGLTEEVKSKINALGLDNRVRLISRVENSRIWELYRMADYFVNLNRQEIFGMAVLEAMYYNCRVVAAEAPGPNYIIENGRSGWIAKSSEEIANIIMQNRDLGQEPHNRIVNSFLWRGTAEKMMDIICKKC